MNETFAFEDKIYRSFPSIMELIEEAGITQFTLVDRIVSELKKIGIDEFSKIFSVTKNQLLSIEGLNQDKVSKLFHHIQIVLRRGPMILNPKQLLERESRYNYLVPPCDDIKHALIYENGFFGFRSDTFIELLGDTNTGKTHWCMTMAAQCIKPIEKGGWGKSIAYIDTEGGFNLHRFIPLADLQNVSEELIKLRLIVSKVSSFDEVEEVIDLLSPMIRKNNIGMIIIDSLITPLQSQYPIGEDLSQAAIRQIHLKKIIDRLKILCHLYDMIVLYTNHVRKEFLTIEEQVANQNKILPQGGNVLAYAPDIRLTLERMNTIDDTEIGRMSITNCGFLPSNSTFYQLSPAGIIDADLSKLANDQSVSKTNSVNNSMKNSMKNSMNNSMNHSMNHQIEDDLMAEFLK